MYETFDDVDFEYNYPISFEYRNKDYLKSDNPPFAKWHQGDTVDIIFKIDNNSCNQGSNNPESALSDMYLTLKLYNFRREHIGTFTNGLGGILVVDEENRIHWPINKELSSKIKKGIYYCGITAEVDDEVDTLVDANYCSLYVS